MPASKTTELLKLLKIALFLINLKWLSSTSSKANTYLAIFNYCQTTVLLFEMNDEFNMYSIDVFNMY